MLKRLDLVGFKSFADKTEFEFSDGLTAIVGPNGSGKSNVVDAVRWVLGEQSAKSLRGSEMCDVIFNGSASRKSLGMAEVTMTFDNRRQVLATPTSEVQITRRVYRSGEGEYLINGQLARLKDIKDLFLGSGAGTDAYSIIEQGRVDSLLQASTRERRIIFEEAAGISRFKAKKIETQRKLERVDQNLMRLKDIIDEVEKQLRSVRLQAAKAQRFQEHSQRLRELRVGLSLQEYHQLAQQFETARTSLDQLRHELHREMAQAEQWERQLQEVEQGLARLDEVVREHEATLSGAQQQIATERTRRQNEVDQSAELEADRERTRRHLAELGQRVQKLSQSAAASSQELQEVATQAAAGQEGVAQLEADLSATQTRLQQLHEQVQRDQAEHLELMRRAGHLQNDVVSYKAEMDNLLRAQARLRQKSDQAANHLASLEQQLQELVSAEDALQERLSETRQRLADQRQERDRLLALREQTGVIASELKAQRSGLVSRIEVLEGLERSHEGLDTGVREVLALVEQPDPGVWRAVRGIIADFLTVRREYAPLIDLALAQRAQCFVVRDRAALDEALASRTQPFSGRVSFLPLGGTADTSARANRLLEVSAVVRLRMPTSAEGAPVHPGVIALAEQVVHCEDPELADLPHQLLAHTLIVRDLSTARAIAAHASGYRFVTLQGELLEPDGTLTVGTYHAEAGILSRKSELRELREQVQQLDQRLADIEGDLTLLREQIARQQYSIEGVQQEIDVLAEQAADLRSRVVQQKERRDGLHEEVALSQSEMQGLDQEIRALEQALDQARRQAAQAEVQVQELQSGLEQAEREIRQRDHERQHQQEASLAAQVALAQVEERRVALQKRQEQLQGDLSQRQLEWRQAEARQRELEQRLSDNFAMMLLLSERLAHAYVIKERCERALATLLVEREQQRRERHQLHERTQSERQTRQTRQEQAHARELEVNDLQYRLSTLVQRLQEDYQLDLAQLYQERLTNPPPAEPVATEGETAVPTEPTPVAPTGIPQLDTQAVNDEITELRRKLSRLGSVNLDALEELAELEKRATELQAQYDDLITAKKSLEEIITRINTDSRRLFGDTLNTVRGHFQELFRKLFGGGQADIVLEDEADILESGIEIIARPPGKELRSISLMSGGEKTLTAVALLLAIFRSKPSPFCILDEVDAALDEANVGRLATVLREFLDRSQFILITHHKRTMASADVLYGVTMQESGISKRIAVRFDDWPDDERDPQVA